VSPSAYPRETLRGTVPRRGSRANPRKSIFDPVHGPIQLDGLALALVGSPEFQRLWQIRQTGFAHLVFPGANHTRLEHSLGAFWVAGRMAERLDLGEERTQRVTAGALLHDLGHGPFSHTLDGPMVESLGYDHETVSRACIEGSEAAGTSRPPTVPRILEHYGLSPREVADLIDPPTSGSAPRLLREILHGAVDADRIDYLQRDAHYTGVGHGAIDATRLLDTMRAADGRLVFAEKGRSAVEGFLVGRALMYSTVYYHKTVRAAEMMAQAAVERFPGFPEAARHLFRATDGELLVRLHDAGGVSANLVAGIEERRLLKRAHGWRTLDTASHARWRRLLRHPAERRALEDEIAGHVGTTPGRVLVDLAGLEPRGDPGDDWANVGLSIDDRVTFPFRGPSPWRELAARAPADWAVSVYADVRVRAATTRWLSRDPSVLP
jgi:uncharacterized protein